MNIKYKRGILYINEHEIDTINIIQTLGVILLIIIAFFEGAQFKKQQTEQIIRYCGASVINASGPIFPSLTAQNTNSNTNITNNLTSANYGFPD